MKVILLQEVEKLGEEGSIVSVKDGFGRNYLIPRGLARLATPGSVKAWQEERRQAARKLAQKKGDAEKLAAEMAGIELIIRAKVGEENRIFGTITAQQVVDALVHEGITVDRRKVELDEEIRLLGMYTASVKLHSDVVAKVKVRVEPEGGIIADQSLFTSDGETPETEDVPDGADNELDELDDEDDD